MNFNHTIVRWVFVIPTWISCKVLKYVRCRGGERFSCFRNLFFKNGVYPILDHFYEPLFNSDKLSESLDAERELSGIYFEDDRYKSLLKEFAFKSELETFYKMDSDGINALQFHHGNGNYEYGDAESLYCMIRHFKPSKIIEIGCGYSTLMALEAEKKNEEVFETKCQHICIEPYPSEWLKNLPVELIQEKLERIDKSIFETLESGDILFIDSTHMIRPQGDVLTEYLSILPLIKKGVLVHIHDIFSPRDYPEEWIKGSIRMWNEQYLLEAFLTCNNSFEIILPLNYLKHHLFREICETFPAVKKHSEDEPGAFWIRRVQD